MTNTYDRFNSWKGLAYTPKLQALSKGNLVLPVNWHVYVSNACPYSCNFCIMKDRVEGAKLQESVLAKIARDAPKFGIELIHISGGGDPLTHPRINQFIQDIRFNSRSQVNLIQEEQYFLEWAKKRYDLEGILPQQSYSGVEIAMSTNGFFLENLYEPVDHLRVSFNAGTRETYKKIHGVDGFDKVIQNISKAAHGNRKGKDIGMGFVLTDENYHEVERFIRIAENCGVDFVHIRPAYLPEKDSEIIEAVKQLSKQKLTSDKVSVFCVSDKFDGYWNKLKYPCLANPLHAVTDATGEFLICQDRLDLRWGDYNKESFESIWFSSEHKKIMSCAQKCDIRCVETGLNRMITSLDDLRLKLV